MYPNFKRAPRSWEEKSDKQKMFREDIQEASKHERGQQTWKKAFFMFSWELKGSVTSSVEKIWHTTNFLENNWYYLLK